MTKINGGMKKIKKHFVFGGQIGNEWCLNPGPVSDGNPGNQVQVQ